MPASLLTVTPLTASGISHVVDDIPYGPVAWFDATKIGGVSSGASLSVWTDISGSGSHATQSLATMQPTFVTSAIGTNSAVSFGSGGTHVLKFISSSYQTTGTLFMVFSPRFKGPDGVNHGIISRSRVAGTGVLFDHDVRSTNLVSTIIRTNATQDADTWIPSWATSVTRYHTIDFDLSLASDIFHTYANSVLTSTMTTVSNESVFEANGITNIGADDGALNNSFYSGLFGEIIIYNYVLSTSERTRVDSYLSAKWGPFA